MTSSAWTAEVDGAVADAPAEGPSRIGRNVAALAGGQATTWVMSLAWTIVVPRALGPAGMGIIVTALAVTGVLGIVLGLGTRNYLVREIVVDPAAAPQLIGTGIVLRLVLTPLFVVAIVGYAHFADYGHDATLALYLAAAASILILLAEPMQAGFQAIERMQYLAYSEVITKSAQGIVGIALVLVGIRAVGIVASSAVVAAVVLGLNVRWLWRYVRVDLRTSRARLADMVRQSVAYWAFGLFFMVYLWIDSVMLSLMTRPEVVGWYGVPTKLFQTLMFLPVLLSTAWLPRLVSAFEQGPERLTRAARAPLELVVVLSAPICAATAILAGPVIHLLYGSAYNEAVPVLVILGLCVPPMYLNIMLNNVLVAAKRQVWWTCVMAGATIVNPLLNFALIRFTDDRYGNGAIGAAASLLLTEALIVLVGFVMVGRDVFDRSAARRCALAVAASAAMWAFAYTTSPVVGTLPSLVGAALVFVGLAALFRLARPDEIAFVRSGLARALRRS
jgi:O-antigen/teichoic acid export membrane protein